MSKNIYVNARAFNNVKNREKTIEGRIKRGLFNNIFVGEIVNLAEMKKTSLEKLDMKDFSSLIKDIKRQFKLANIDQIFFYRKVFDHS